MVSVIIPLYNAADWIEETLESVYKQTHAGVELEVIVIDDASTDESAEVARRSLEASGICHRLIRQTVNAGCGASRNVGLQVARGEWVQLLDADDLLPPGKIRWQLDRTDASTSVVYSDWQWLERRNGGWQRGWRSSPVIGEDPSVSIIRGDGFLAVGSHLVRRCELRRLGGFDEYRVLEDVHFMLRLALAGGRFVRAESAEPGLLRRRISSSVSETHRREMCIGGLRNTRMVRDAWLREGTLTDARCAALAYVYSTVAHKAVVDHPSLVEDAISEGLALDPRPDLVLLRSLTRIAGAEKIGAILRGRRRFRMAMSRLKRFVLRS
jgi:glycosyltransferase involved in cell wall biosynthesis